MSQRPAMQVSVEEILKAIEEGSQVMLLEVLKKLLGADMDLVNAINQTNTRLTKLENSVVYVEEEDPLEGEVTEDANASE